MQKTGHQPPFFCVAAISGLVLAYHKVSEAIGSEQPFYGLEHPGIQVGTEPAESIEAIAERLLEDVLVIMDVKFPGRTLQLGGWSMGGIVAIEMARQLRQKQHSLSVSTVVLIDSFAPVAGLAGQHFFFLNVDNRGQQNSQTAQETTMWIYSWRFRRVPGNFSIIL